MATLARTLIRAGCRLLPLALAACSGGWYEYALPSPVSPLPVADSTLRAGFGRADITPPPGVGLGGNGPEGRVSTGWRHRLYVRALVLQDARGERVALVVADLPHISTNLHRLAAQRLVGPTGIGADRLIVSATHTHSSAAHFYAERQYNSDVARLPGYDPALADFLVSGIAHAVQAAYDDLRPARAGWLFHSLVGFTRNRSMDAYCRNPDAVEHCRARDSVPADPRHAVDTMWSLLRVDRKVDGKYRPAGAYSVFAIHGTANPSITTILDGDIHAVVERRLERAIDSLYGGRMADGYQHKAVHVFANGAEGDASPNRDTVTTQCPVPALRPRPFTGPRAVSTPWAWEDADSGTLRHCFAEARRFIDSAGAAMVQSVLPQFKDMDSSSLHTDLVISRAFTTIRLPGRNGLCLTPAIGTSTAAGASDVPTRVRGWRLLGIVPLGFEQGGSARRKRPAGCQAEKRVLLGPVQRLATGEHGLPDVAQLAVVRIGDVLVGAVPFEPTSMTGRLLKTAMLDGADSARTRHLKSVVVGLANGFVQYVATRDEYGEQAYEGGSTLYGPRTAEVLAEELRGLAARLNDGGSVSGPAEVAPITAFPGAPIAIMPGPTTFPALVGPPTWLSRACRDHSLELSWLDEAPGRLRPAEGQVVAVDSARSDGSWAPFAWDDQSDVLVESVGGGVARRPHGSAVKGHVYRATIARNTAGRDLRLRILGPGGAIRLEHASIAGCP